MNMQAGRQKVFANPCFFSVTHPQSPADAGAGDPGHSWVLIIYFPRASFCPGTQDTGTAHWECGSFSAMPVVVAAKPVISSLAG